MRLGDGYEPAIFVERQETPRKGAKSTDPRFADHGAGLCRSRCGIEHRYGRLSFGSLGWVAPSIDRIGFGYANSQLGHSRHAALIGAGAAGKRG